MTGELTKIVGEEILKTLDIQEDNPVSVTRKNGATITIYVSPVLVIHPIMLLKKEQRGKTTWYLKDNIAYETIMSDGGCGYNMCELMTYVKEAMKPKSGCAVKEDNMKKLLETYTDGL